MPKEKISHIFNRNHVEILKIEYPEHPYLYSNEPVIDYINSSFETKEEVEHVGKDGLVTCESKLGFYYKRKPRYHNNCKKVTNYRKKTVITFTDKDGVVWQMKYVTAYDDNVSQDTEDGLRPWDVVPGDKDFPDNMLDALVKDANDFFLNISESGYTNVYARSGWHHGRLTEHDKIASKNVTDTKKTIFKELFGNEKGPIFQTNEEKILAHGFDLKYSFRKDKEKK